MAANYGTKLSAVQVMTLFPPLPYPPKTEILLLLVNLSLMQQVIKVRTVKDCMISGS